VDTPPSDIFSRDDLRGVALLALLVAHGADGELDPREIDALAERLLGLDSDLSSDEVMAVFRGAAKIYALKGARGEEIIAELAESLDSGARRRAYALLRAVAEADSVIHPSEFTLLRHVCEAWEIIPPFGEERTPDAE
jgi:tellurite resistance protein